MLHRYIAQNCFVLSDEDIDEAFYNSQSIRELVLVGIGRVDTQRVHAALDSQLPASRLSV